MKASTTRREFLRDAALVGSAAAALRAADAVAAEKPDAALPRIKLGKLEVSRLILGSNPFFGFSHGNPQASAGEMKKYYTPERIMAVMDRAAEQGVDAVWTPCYDHWIKLWHQYRKKGGKLKIWIGQPDNYDQMTRHITACAKNGGKAICIQGESIDRAFREGKHEMVRKWLDLIKKHDLPAGMASHRPETHLVAEEKKLPTDFYHQCVYQPENYSTKCRDAALATIRKLDKPVVAYKVLAAGRLAPKDAFSHLLKHIRPKDGLCVGMFPKKRDEVAEDAALAAKLSVRTTRPA